MHAQAELAVSSVRPDNGAEDRRRVMAVLEHDLADALIRIVDKTAPSTAIKGLGVKMIAMRFA